MVETFTLAETLDHAIRFEIRRERAKVKARPALNVDGRLLGMEHPPIHDDPATCIYWARHQSCQHVSRLYRNWPRWQDWQLL